MVGFTALACLFFVVVMVVMPAIKGSDYAPGTSSISEGALGRFGWLQTSAFYVLGAASVLLAFVLRDVGTGVSGVLVPALTAVWGVGILLCGIFPVDEGAKGETTTAKIHLMAALIAFVALIAAMWFASFSFRGNATWASWSTASIVTSAVATAALVVLVAAPQECSWGGYAQRGFILILLIWLAGVALVAA